MVLRHRVLILPADMQQKCFTIFQLGGEPLERGDYVLLVHFWADHVPGRTGVTSLDEIATVLTVHVGDFGATVRGILKQRLDIRRLLPQQDHKLFHAYHHACTGEGADHLTGHALSVAHKLFYFPGLAHHFLNQFTVLQPFTDFRAIQGRDIRRNVVDAGFNLDRGADL